MAGLHLKDSSIEVKEGRNEAIEIATWTAQKQFDY
jgi:hypothetical protein